MTEYTEWYQPGSTLARCLDCGALLSSNDTEIHTKWHKDLTTMLVWG